MTFHCTICGEVAGLEEAQAAVQTLRNYYNTAHPKIVALTAEVELLKVERDAWKTREKWMANRLKEEKNGGDNT
jgi:hypothetical protein